MIPEYKNRLKAPVSEVFFSYQGEGPFFGKPQIFVRFYGCNISCNYCDTPLENYTETGIETLLKRIKLLFLKNKNIFESHDSAGVVLTGGEPMMHADFLLVLARKLKKMRLNVMLETNGILYAGLGKLIKYIDTVSMDIKLPSGCRSNYFAEHRRFLRSAPNKTYVKIVVAEDTRDKEVFDAVELVSSVSANIPFVFQPVTPQGKIHAPSQNDLIKWVNSAEKKLNNVYLIPQLHKIWKIK